MWIARVWRILGWLFLILAGLELLPLVMAVAKGDGDEVGAFAMGVGAAAFSGLVLIVVNKDIESEKDRRVGLLLTLLVWVVIPVLGAIPLHISGIYGSMGQAYFETVSGFTTTGASVLPGFAGLSDSILLWRSLLEWSGGFLAILLALCVFGSLNIGAMAHNPTFLPHGEGETLDARLRLAAVVLAPIYVVATLVGWMALWVSGEPRFEALCLALSGIATGGFSPYSHGAIQGGGTPTFIVLGGLLVFGALSLTAVRRFLRFSGPRAALRTESRVILWGLVVIFAISFAAAFLTALNDGQTEPLGFATRIAFVTISAVSTTGYIPADMPLNSLVAVIILLVLVFIGGAAASTTGGVRIMRVALLFQHAKRELRRLIHPHRVMTLGLDGRTLPERDVDGLWAVFLSAVALVLVASILFAIDGHSFQESIVLGITGISNAGPFAHALLPEFAGFAAFSTFGAWIYGLLMLIGRLEMIALIAIASRSFWNP